MINRPSKLTIEELSAKIYGSKIEWDKLIHVGGPVGGPLIMIHQISDMADEPITEDIFRTVDPDKLREMLQEQVEPSILIANYAGWGPLQLEAEISEGSWEIMPGSPAFVFWTGIKDLWDVLIGELQASQIADMLKIQKSNIDPKLN